LAKATASCSPFCNFELTEVGETAEKRAGAEVSGELWNRWSARARGADPLVRAGCPRSVRCADRGPIANDGVRPAVCASRPSLFKLREAVKSAFEPPMNADKRRSDKNLLIGVYRRSSAANSIFQRRQAPHVWFHD
jgi:hypothetical protein